MPTRWRCVIWAALLTAGCATAPPAPAPGPVEWQYKGSTNYEAEAPGAGVGKRYESAVGWIDVYLFSAGRDSWLDGTGDEHFQEQFAEILTGILEWQKRGRYRDVSFSTPVDVVIAGHRFRHCVATFEFDDMRVESHTYMTALNGRLLKYRMSFQDPVPPSLPRIITDFIEQTAAEYERLETARRP